MPVKRQQRKILQGGSGLKRDLENIAVEYIGEFDLSAVSDGEQKIFFDSLLDSLKRILPKPQGENDNGNQKRENI